MQAKTFLPIGIGALLIVMAALVIAVIVLAGDDDGRADGCSDDALVESLTLGESQAQTACAVGTFVPSQGRSHFPGGFAGHTPTPFCEGVPHTDATGATSITIGASPAASPSAVPTNCYLSNPPSSGEHLNVQRNVDVGGVTTLNLPPDPGVYPDDIEIPRDAIPHILEHAGVFIGWNCGDSDSACVAAVDKVKSIVNDRIDNDDDRVVMAHDRDLPSGEIGMSAWTRVDRFAYREFDTKRVTEFIAKNSCRFDPEGFCQ